MNHITAMLKMHSRNWLSWFFMPWCILLFSLAINLFIGLLLNRQKAIYTGGLSSIYIFMFVLGILTLRDTFPFALGFSVRRIDYLLGTIVMVLATSLMSALLLFLLSLIENNVVVNWGVDVHFFHLPYMSDGSLIEQFWVYFVPLAHLYFLGFAIGSIYRRFGGAGMLTFFGIVFLLASAAALLLTYSNQWGTLFAWFSQYTAFTWACWLVPLTLIYALIAYALLRKATI